MNDDRISDLEIQDFNTIDALRKKYDLENPEHIKKIYNSLLNGEIRFSTKDGNDFDDYISEKYEYFKNKGYYNVNGKKKKSPIKAGGSSKQNVKSQTESSRKDNAITSEKKEYEVLLNSESDEDFDSRVRKEMIKGERKRTILVVSFGLIAAACLIYCIIYYFLWNRTENNTAKLASMINTETDSFTTDKPKPVLPENEETGTNVETGPPEVLEKYSEVLNINKSLIGWIQIADTIIDYPVMQTVDNEYYLTHNFSQEYDKNGSIFLDCNCSIYPRSTNLIVYGHHMKSGNMFGTLQNYQTKKFYNKHKYILFDTIYDEGVYEVMYVFRDKVHSAQDVGFKYYEFTDAYSEEEFNSYMNEMAELSLYDTGVSAEFGDSLLTLSTCDYQEKNGRFVVVAKRVYID